MKTRAIIIIVWAVLAVVIAVLRLFFQDRYCLRVGGGGGGVHCTHHHTVFGGGDGGLAALVVRAAVLEAPAELVQFDYIYFRDDETQWLYLLNILPLPCFLF